MTVKSEEQTKYLTPERDAEDDIILQALSILRNRLQLRYYEPQAQIGGTDDMKMYLQLFCADRPHEIFGVVFLNSKHRVLNIEVVATGTIDGASVPPREVVKAVLKHNAAAVVFFHNHPSGDTSPSRADRAITDKLVTALNSIDVRVLDHIIVGEDEPYSFAEHGGI